MFAILFFFGNEKIQNPRPTPFSLPLGYYIIGVGEGGVSKTILRVQSIYFGNWGLHAKFHNPRTTLSGRILWGSFLFFLFLFLLQNISKLCTMHCILCILYYALQTMHCILFIAYYAWHSLQWIVCIALYVLHLMHSIVFYICCLHNSLWSFQLALISVVFVNSLYFMHLF